jgi:hypothetical protein
MVLVGLKDISNAREITGYIDQPAVYATTPEKLVALAKSAKPLVAFVGSQIGGRRVRSVDLIPVMLRRNRSLVIVYVGLDPSQEETIEAIENGAYAVLDVAKPHWPARLRVILDVIERRRASLSSPLLPMARRYH